ncbi:response regulator [Azorhizobium caulinodans]|uniref:response regulator n=1 Tax=Azorhizobium caulinodans TaxID=7 RepID=UPI0009D65CAF|nr:response regulator [Azorhizobium caulinodans]
MGESDFNRTAVSLSKNPLGIIALFIVLVYGMASLSLVLSNMPESDFRVMLYFLILFPVVVLFVFVWLVVRHNAKLFSPSDFSNENNYVYLTRDQTAAAAYLAVASTKDQGVNGKIDIGNIADLVLESFDLSRRRPADWKRHLLWVDDFPDNNIYERKAFEAIGIKISISTSTKDALDRVANKKFGAIISDMGRREGPREGYVLLEALRSRGYRTPFFIYAGSNLSEHRREALDRGAQGSTNDPQDLFEMVTRELMST